MQILWSLKAFRSINRRGRYFSLLFMPDITSGIKRAEVVRTMLLLKFIASAAILYIQCAAALFLGGIHELTILGMHILVLLRLLPKIDPRTKPVSAVHHCRV